MIPINSTDETFLFELICKINNCEYRFFMNKRCIEIFHLMTIFEKNQLNEKYKNFFSKIIFNLVLKCDNAFNFFDGNIHNFKDYNITDITKCMDKIGNHEELCLQDLINKLHKMDGYQIMKVACIRDNSSISDIFSK